MMRSYILWLCLTSAALAQTASPTSEQTAAAPQTVPAPVVSAPAVVNNLMSVPAGTKLPIVIKHAISTKNAKVSDPIYAETNFPVVLDGRVVIPVGTYVQGMISRVQRPGRIKGRGELLVHFNTLIFPNGYTVILPGALDNVPGSDGKVKDQEGTLQSEGSKGKDAATIATATLGGAEMGTLIGATRGTTGKGAAIGTLGGGVVGLATVLLTRGPDLRIESGTTIEIVLERPVSIDRQRARARD